MIKTYCDNCGKIMLNCLSNKTLTDLFLVEVVFPLLCGKCEKKIYKGGLDKCIREIQTEYRDKIIKLKNKF